MDGENARRQIKKSNWLHLCLRAFQKWYTAQGVIPGQIVLVIIIPLSETRFKLKWLKCNGPLKPLNRDALKDYQICEETERLMNQNSGTTDENSDPRAALLTVSKMIRRVVSAVVLDPRKQASQWFTDRIRHLSDADVSRNDL